MVWFQQLSLRSRNLPLTFEIYHDIIDMTDMKNVIIYLLGGAYRPDLITVFTRDAPIAIFLAYSDFRFFWKCDLPIPIFFSKNYNSIYKQKSIANFNAKIFT